MFAELQRQYAARKKIRKLRDLRSHLSPAGYTLKHFDEFRCVFIHIPKCAGVSVSQSLFGNQGAGHYSASTLRQVLGDDAYDQYFTFTFVRDPWDRLASAFHFLKRGGFNDTDRRWADKHLRCYADFREFVRQWVTPDNVRSWVHFQPQCDFLCKADGSLDVDFVGRFERLEEDFQLLCSKLGIERTLRSLNQSTHGVADYSADYDEQTRNIVAQVYADDIALLNETLHQNTTNNPTPSTSR